MITTHLVVKNNELTIEKTLESLLPLGGKILIGDLGCTDKTIDKCKAYSTEIVKLSLNNDMSQVRNSMMKLSKTQWNFYIEPWEVLMSDSFIEYLNTPEVYRASIFQGDLVTKQARIWHKEKKAVFVNPVFETLKADESEELPVYIASNSPPNQNIALVENWCKKQPLASQPIYYMACVQLTNKNWDAFLNYSEMFLYRETKDAMPVLMTNYYRAMVFSYIKKDQQSSIKSLFPCIIAKPMMAEFWCLLADSYYSLKDYDRAKCLYENAIILGSRRLQNDDWPMEISKYKEYPQKMINGCNSIMQSSRFYFGKNQTA